MFKDLWKKFIKSQYEYFFGTEYSTLLSQITELQEQVKSLKELANQTSALIEPKKLGTITINELKSLLLPYVPVGSLYLSDRIYGLTSVEEAKRFSAETKIFARTWVEELHDCDEFSSALNGYWNDGLSQFAFGIAWSSPHAFNILVDEKKQVWIVEPQTNKFTKIEDMKNNTTYSPLKLILI